MKKIILIIALIISAGVKAQDDKTVTLVVSGQGKTQDEAKQNALRSAIEQAFGAFISSKTEILNDSLVKDEIVSVSSGNIQKFEIISEVQIPGGAFATTLSAVVSVSKLTSFCKGKGVVVEFSGSLIAMNAKLDNLNMMAEAKAIENLAKVCSQILSKSVDYSLTTDEPKCQENSCDITFKVTYELNKNINLFYSYFYSTIEKIEMTKDEKKKYLKNNRKVYSLVYGKVTFPNGPKISEYHYLRNRESIKILNNLFYTSSNQLYQFKISSEAGDITIGEIDKANSRLKKLSYGFPAATSIQFRAEGIGMWGYGPLDKNLREDFGIMVHPLNTKPNSELGYIVFTKTISLSDIGLISKFEIVPPVSN